MAAVQARECEKDSAKFVGLCMNVDNCANVCRGEGFASARLDPIRAGRTHAAPSLAAGTSESPCKVQ
ncbi:hypothetical protein C2845_PM15G02310 [Panicum miliaceum]|uniref:Knottins-like domain-containing protein n=1 Tax=Panicum miliaceum TaxID=4540 RepID=A0A3L6QBJ8_PANMI|nr:hypothetical protein C2845_PM15G02310 [Panicum miliaceum]